MCNVISMKTSELRKINKRNVLRYALRNKSATKPELASVLGLSIPTVGQLVEELISEGLLRTAGTEESSGGRRAVRIEPVIDAHHAVGVDITKHHVYFIVVNLAGETVASERVRRRYEDKPEFYEFLTSYRRDMCERYQIQDGSILGIGVAVQGLISQDQKYFYSHMLENQRVTKVFDFNDTHPHFFLNDGTASCMSEYFDENTPDDFVYLMLSRTVGGAVVHNRKIQEGIDFHAGEFGHMILHPDREEVCYCGGKGHMWCYNSVPALEDFVGGTYHQFFEHLFSGEEAYVKRLDTFLDDLALAVCNLRMFYDSTVIIGGYLSAYLEPYMPYLRSRVAELDHMYAESKAEILLGRHSVDAAGVGAARYFVEKYLREL